MALNFCQADNSGEKPLDSALGDIQIELVEVVRGVACDRFLHMPVRGHGDGHGFRFVRHVYGDGIYPYALAPEG